MTKPVIPTMVLGGSGYVAGELLRLLVGHPQFRLVGVMSESRAGNRVCDSFPQLQSTLGDMSFSARADLQQLLGPGPLALFSAAPHGASAALIADFIKQAQTQDCNLSVVDVSADFRFSDRDAYKRVYGTEHGSPELLGDFTSALPEHLPRTTTPHVGHPGCFATALLLASVPLMKLGISAPDLYATGITGSTGSGRTAIPGTHHPERHSNLYAYKPLAHRHAPEVEALAGLASGRPARVHFVPHSGPFARGIHVTVQATPTDGVSLDQLIDAFRTDYADKPFVELASGPPRIKDVVGSNRARIHVAMDGGSFVVMTVIDNLVKGAAGGAMQWMNRLLDLDETAGLTQPGPAWT